MTRRKTSGRWQRNPREGKYIVALTSWPNVTISLMIQWCSKQQGDEGTAFYSQSLRPHRTMKRQKTSGRRQRNPREGKCIVALTSWPNVTISSMVQWCSKRQGNEGMALYSQSLRPSQNDEETRIPTDDDGKTKTTTSKGEYHSTDLTGQSVR